MEKKKVLVVENEDHLRSLYERILASSGFKVTQASTAAEGLMKYTQEKDIDLVLSDFNMPGQDGAWLFQKLFKVDPKVRFILITGNTLTKNDPPLKGLKISKLLKKPIELGALIGAVKECVKTSGLGERRQ